MRRTEVPEVRFPKIQAATPDNKIYRILAQVEAIYDFVLHCK